MDTFIEERPPLCSGRREHIAKGYPVRQITTWEFWGRSKKKLKRTRN